MLRVARACALPGFITVPNSMAHTRDGMPSGSSTSGSAASLQDFDVPGGGGRRFALRRVISVCFGPPALVATLAAAAGRLRHLVYVVAKTVPAVQNGPCRSGFAYRTTEAILRGIVGKCIRRKAPPRP